MIFAENLSKGHRLIFCRNGTISIFVLALLQLSSSWLCFIAVIVYSSCHFPSWFFFYYAVFSKYIDATINYLVSTRLHVVIIILLFLLYLYQDIFLSFFYPYVYLSLWISQVINPAKNNSHPHCRISNYILDLISISTLHDSTKRIFIFIFIYNFCAIINRIHGHFARKPRNWI